MRFEGTPDELIGAAGGPTRVTFTVSDPGVLAGLERQPGVLGVDRWGAEVEVRCDPQAVVAVVAAMHHRGLEPADLRVVRPSLEDAFVALTTPSVVPSVPSGSTVTDQEVAA